MEYFDIVLVIILLILSAVLWFMAGICDRLKNSKWKLIWLAPAVLCCLLMTISGMDKGLIFAYLGTLILCTGFFTEKMNIRRMLSIISAVTVLATIPLCLCTDIYRRDDYTGDFKEIFKEAKKRYVLTKHKGINWDELYNKYLPQFEKATKDNDAEENYITWAKLCAEFNDGHVGYTTKESIVDDAEKRAAGNDHGLVIMKLSDGRFVALNTDLSVQKLGIHQLTEITSWNGMSVDEADKMSEFSLMKGYADIDNEKFYEGIYAAGTGEGSVEVGYIDNEGNNKTAVLPVLNDDYYSRLEEVLKKVNQSIPEANMTVKMLDKTTAGLRICAMSYNADSQKNEDYKSLKTKLKNDLLDMKEQGMKDLIIDIRGNSGGSGGMVSAIAEILAPTGEHFYAADPVWDRMTNSYKKDENGDYVFDHEVTFKGSDILNGGKIIILVNSASVSAADHITKIMSGFDNVTVIGFTEPNGSAMGVSRISGEYGSLYLSSSVLLDKDGSIFIDSGKDRQSGDDLDIKIPFDEEAVRQIFDNDKDYLLEKAKEVIAKQ